MLATKSIKPLYSLLLPWATAYLDNNKLYIIGVFNGVKYTKITKLNTNSLKDSIYSLYISYENEIFLITSAGDVFKNNNESTIRFERIILFNDNDFVRKFCTGNGFVCVLTGQYKHLVVVATLVAFFW